jgi:hypothetical protein
VEGSSVNRKLKAMVEAIAEVLDEYKLKGKFSYTGRHPNVEVMYLGDKIRYTFAGTSGDARAVLNTKLGFRRVLREVEQRKKAA